MKLVRLLFLALLLALAVPAVAAADAEPNDGLWQAEGPIAGGVDVQGALTTDGDTDWYVFYAQPQRQLHLTAEGDCGVVLHDADGSSLPDDYTTPPGASRRYFVQVFGSDCTDYSFRLEPVTAVTTGPSMPVPEPTAEPNEANRQAGGPLAGATTYSGTLETANDEDWFYFYTTPGTHQLDISVTGLSYCYPVVELVGHGVDDYDHSASPDVNNVSHITLTVSGRQRFAIRVHDPDCVGADWQFRIDPAEAVGPPPPSCDAERARYAAAVRAVGSAQRALRHAHGRKARLRAKRRLRTARSAETRAANALDACVAS